MPSGPDTPARSYRFGDCTLDGLVRELRRAGEPVPLQPKVFDLLLYLIEHRDRAVDKSELQKVVWAGAVVEDGSVNQAIRKARRAIGDDAERQATIRTVHGHGYRFIADVLTDQERTARARAGDASLRSAESSASGEPSLSGSLLERRARPLLLSALAAVLIALASAAWWLHSRSLDPTAVRLAVLPVEDDTGRPDTAWVRYGLMSVASGLAAAADVAVISDGDIVSVLKTAGERDATWIVQKLTDGYGATHVLAMRLEARTGLLRLTSELRRGETTLRSATYLGEDPVELLRIAVADAIKPLGGAAGGGEDFVLADDAFVNEAYARGRAYSLEGACRDAQPMFATAMQHAPHLFEPVFEYAHCARVLGDLPTAERMLQDLLTSHEGELQLQARALNALGVVYNVGGRQEESHRTYASALEYAAKAGDPELQAHILVNLGITAKDRSRFEEARDFLGRAIAAYQDAGRTSSPGHVYSTLANIALEQGALAEADDAMSRALHAFRSVGDRRREALVLNNFGLLSRLQQRYDEAESYHLESARIREEIGDVVGLGAVHNLLAVLHLERGRLDQAIAAAQQAHATASASGDKLFQATATVHIADAEMGQGRLDEAETSYRTACDVFEDIDDRMRTLECALRLARVHTARRRFSAARDAAREALSQARERNFTSVQIDALMLLGDVDGAQRRPADARRHYQQALELARAKALQREQREVSIRLAHALLQQDEVAAAESLIGLLSDAPATADLLRLRAEHAARRGNIADARRHMREARELAAQRWSAEDEQTLLGYEAAGR